MSLRTKATTPGETRWPNLPTEVVCPNCFRPITHLEVEQLIEEESHHSIMHFAGDEEDMIGNEPALACLTCHHEWTPGNAEWARALRMVIGLEIMRASTVQGDPLLFGLVDLAGGAR